MTSKITKEQSCFYEKSNKKNYFFLVNLLVSLVFYALLAYFNKSNILIVLLFTLIIIIVGNFFVQKKSFFNVQYLIYILYNMSFIISLLIIYLAAINNLVQYSNEKIYDNMTVSNYTGKVLKNVVADDLKDSKNLYYKLFIKKELITIGIFCIYKLFFIIFTMIYNPYIFYMPTNPLFLSQKNLITLFYIVVIINFSILTYISIDIFTVANWNILKIILLCFFGGLILIVIFFIYNWQQLIKNQCKICYKIFYKLEFLKFILLLLFTLNIIVIVYFFIYFLDKLLSYTGLLLIFCILSIFFIFYLISLVKYYAHKKKGLKKKKTLKKTSSN